MLEILENVLNMAKPMEGQLLTVTLKAFPKLSFYVTSFFRVFRWDIYNFVGAVRPTGKEKLSFLGTPESLTETCEENKT